MKIHPSAYYNNLKHSKDSYYIQKSNICNKIISIYNEFGGILGHRSMKVFLERNGINLSKTTIHKYINQELKLYSICRRSKHRYRKGKHHKIFRQFFIFYVNTKNGA